MLRDRPYVCLPCNEFFQTKNELTLHTASHEDKGADQQQDPSTGNESAAEDGESSSTSSDQDTKKATTTSQEGGNTNAPQVVHLPNGTKIELRNVQHGQLMNLERMRMLLAILLKRISTPSRLRRLGYGTKLIDIVLTKSIESSGRKAVSCSDGSVDTRTLLKQNIEILLDWTIPREFMERFRQEKKTVEEILEELTS